MTPLCNGKASYSRRMAEHVRVARLRDRRAPPTYLRIYKCEECPWYHLTHVKPYK